MSSVSLGGSLTSLGEYAFYSCSALSEVCFPDTLTEIPGRAFYRCTALADLTFPANLTKVGDYAFYGCSALTDLAFPASLVEIGDYSFRGCSGLTAVVLADHIARVGIHAFNGSRELTFYCEAQSRPEGWNARWNSNYRPVIWGCTLSEDGSYVVSFTKSERSFDNSDDRNGFSDPLRTGYVFAGWQVGDRLVSCADLLKEPDGTAFTSVWVEAPSVLPPAEEGRTESDASASQA